VAIHQLLGVEDMGKFCFLSSTREEDGNMESNVGTNQHYVPQFLLNNFTSGESGQLYAFDKQTGKVFVTVPRNVASEKGFYDYLGENAVDSIDSHLTELDTTCAPIIEQIVTQQTLAGLSKADRTWLSFFVVLQMVRTRYTKEILRQVSRSIEDHILRLGGNPKEADGFEPISEDNLGQHFTQFLARSPQLVEYLIDKSWLLLSASEPSSFLTSDQPVTFSNSIHKDPNTLGLDVEGIEIYTPLSSKLTLLIACRSYEMRLRSYYKNIEWFEDITKHDQLLVKPPKLDRTYVEMMMNGYDTGDAVGCSSENVTLVNYLQVANSVRFVFNSTDNFDLVRHLIKENSSFVSAPRFSL